MRSLTCCLAAGIAGGLVAVPAAAQDTAHVVIVATTDVHGHVTAWDYVQDRPAPWGLVRAATVTDSLRRAYPGAVVLVDGGDVLQGNPFASYFGTVRPRPVHPIVDVLNLMRYDAAVPGNHDFDFGLDVLSGAIERAAFPVVAANVRRTDRDTTVFAPHVVLARGGVRVGITGLLTPGVLRWHGPALRERLRVQPVAAAAGGAVRDVRAAGADLVVAVVHAGLGAGSSYDTAGVGAENGAEALAAGPDRPDLVVVGHSHDRIRDSVINGVHFVQPQQWARSVSVVHVWMARGGGRLEVVRVDAQEIPLGDVPPEPVLTERLRPMHEEVRYWADQPVTVAEGEWGTRTARVRDTPYLDLLNEVQARRAGADLSAAAAFTTAVPLGPGPVRLRDLEGIYPYENTLRAVRIDGERLRAYLEHSARYFRTWSEGATVIDPAVPGYDYDVVSGVSYAIDLAQPVGGRIRDLTYRGRAVTAADTFTLAVNSHRLAGGGGYTMLQGLPVVYRGTESIRALLAEAMRGAETLRADEHFTPSWRLRPPAAEAAALAMFAPPRPARDTVVMRAVVTGALRGMFAPGTVNGRPVGGLAALRAYADSLERQCACPTVRLDAGGASFGSPLADYSRGAITVTAFDAAGVDAAALGAGDLRQIGTDLAERIGASRTGWVAANAVAPAAAATRIAPWTLVRRGGRTLAVLGIADGVPPGGATVTRGVVSVRDPAAAIAAALPSIRAAGPDAILVVGDFDAGCDSGCSGEALRLAEAMGAGAVHAIVGGTAAATVRGMTVAPVLAYGVGVTVVDVVRLVDGTTETRARVDTVWTDRVVPDSAVQAVLARELAALERALEEPVARLRFGLVGEGVGELPAGRLVADAVRGAGRTQIAMIASASIRRGLPAGAVRIRDLFERFPSPSTLVTVRVSGEALLAALDAALTTDVVPLHVAGITVRYDRTRRDGQRVREARIDGGDRIDRRDTYAVTMTEQLLALPAFAGLAALPRSDVGMTDRDAVARYLRLLRQPVEAPPSERLVSTR